MTMELAYEHHGQRISRAQFYAIACDPARSVAVEACAGAGKTWMLVSRMLRALLAGAQPHEILAITFTRKAAGEMRQRLQQWLEQMAKATPQTLAYELQIRGVPAEEAAGMCVPLAGLYARLLEFSRPVQVRTFHSWFAALLRNAPLAVLQQLGLPSAYELLEDDQQAVDAVWRRFYRTVSHEASLRQDFMDAVAAHGRFNTQKALLSALAKRVEFELADAHGAVDASVRPAGELWAEFAVHPSPDAVLGCLDWQTPLLAAARALGRGATTYAAKGVELEQAVSAGHAPGVLAALLTQAGDPRKFGKLANDPDVVTAQDLAVRLRDAMDQQAAWQHQQRMTRLTRCLLVEFARVKRERGWVDMNDVERAALVLLSDPVLSGWVQERLDTRVKHLLIDEFQDTNPLQWQALHSWLSGYAGAAGDAPSVFLVGDPKQSIYRFRRAEPQVFRAAQTFVVGALHGDLLSCDHTHRNAPGVVEVVNAVMLAAQSAGETSGFRAHTTESSGDAAVLCLPAIGRVAAQEAVGTDRLAWRDSLTTPREVVQDHRLALECRQAAQWIADQLARGHAAADILVLARKREPLSLLQDELRSRHIAAQQPEKNNLADIPEVQDLLALIDVLVSPGHDLSLARVLKSPVFGLKDDALVSLAHLQRQCNANGAPASWWDLLQKEEQETQILRGLGAILSRWSGWVASWPPHDALDAIYHDGDVLARYAAAVPSAMRAAVIANLQALLCAALEVDGGRFLTPYSMVRALRARGAPAPVQPAGGAVRLLTVHGAKGLEAPVVLMLDLQPNERPGESMGVLVQWPGEAPCPERFTFLASERRPPLCNAQAVQAEQQARQREEINALYVAMTRARSTLVLSSSEPYRPVPGSWWERLLPWARPAAQAPAAPGGADTSAPRDPVPVPGRFEVPNLPSALANIAHPAIKEIADEDDESPESRLGQAMHRLLEWARAGDSGQQDGALAAIRREFGLTPSQADTAVAMARRIRHGEGAWAWDASRIDWQGNEVALVHGGQQLRLDRLVRERESGIWWVLDYKSAVQPQRQKVVREQMRTYVAAVEAAHPGAMVRAALMTSDGKLVTL